MAVNSCEACYSPFGTVLRPFQYQLFILEYNDAPQCALWDDPKLPSEVRSESLFLERLSSNLQRPHKYKRIGKNILEHFEHLKTVCSRKPLPTK